MDLQLVKGFISKRLSELRSYEQAAEAIAALEQLDSHAKYLQKQLAESQAALDASKAAHADMIQALEQERERAKKAIAAEIEKANVLATAQIEKIEKSVAETQQDEAAVKLALRKAKDQLAAVEGNIKEKKREYAELDAAHDKLSKIIDDKKAAIAKL